ncbi:MAG: hotdog fold thioesterase [Solirubrobacteraceae bacterium]|nr:hotdog fold thioesterase [Patulibacter sp.]
MPEPTAPFRLTTKDGDDVLPSLLPIENTLDGTLGVEYVSATKEEVRAETQIDDRHKQPFALVHGGVYACVAESAASIGGMLTAIETGGSAVGISNNTAFVRPFVGDGILSSVATRIHGGRTTQLWDVDHRDPQGRLCATSRVTIALRPAPVGPKD